MALYEKEIGGRLLAIPHNGNVALAACPSPVWALFAALCGNWITISRTLSYLPSAILGCALRSMKGSDATLRS